MSEEQLAFDIEGMLHEAAVESTPEWRGAPLHFTTVYYPPQLAKAGHQLALDLGIHRTMPSVAPMRLDRLTLILTGPLAAAQ